MDVIRASDLRMCGGAPGRSLHGWVIDGDVIGYPAFQSQHNLYWVQLDRCRSAAGALQTIAHVSRKGWATGECLAGLINALDSAVGIYSLK